MKFEVGSFLCFLFLVLVTICDSQKDIQVANCGGSDEIKVSVTPCSKEPCSLNKGSVATVQATFVANQDSSKLKLKISAKVRNFDAPFPGLRNNACRGQGLTCPLVKGKTYTFKYGLRILPFYPALKTNATFNIIGDRGTVLCFTAPVEIR